MMLHYFRYPMTRLRPAVALLLNLLFLQAILLGSGAGCAMRFGAPMSSSATHEATGRSHDVHAGAQHAAHGMHEQEDAPSVPAADQAPDEDGQQGVPHAPSHCTTATTCSFVATAGSTATLARPILTDTDAEWGQVDVPPSVRTAPEPPPPRA
jgi:hypothetical protein